LKLVSESRVTWATSVPILLFLGLSILELGPMYATDRRQTKASLNACALLAQHDTNLKKKTIETKNKQHLITNLCLFKGYVGQKLLKQFCSKSWNEPIGSC